MRSDDRRTQLERDLPGAAGRGEIVAVFQAQYSLATGAIVAAEALSRWIHPRFGLVEPAEFIPMAERLGLIGRIGDVMLRIGCQAARDWQATGHEIEVAVNVSILQLRTREILTTISGLLKDLSLSPRLLTLELTESTPLADVPEAADTLHDLSRLGVNISVDDFGSEYSSREQVIALPATELKIDQALVRESRGDNNEELARAVEFGKARGMRLVAEGIETPEQLERVRALECDRGQGYLLSRPTTKADLDGMLVSAAGMDTER
ncbi:EAL domain-containing protein [Diaminobutyricibacter sp. McL0618]|uniref:EAL domain-containing protein n=1 Tax=Leifsonia sp. McL0618 TaxID=3415677 RepID=UPI003CE9FBAE